MNAKLKVLIVDDDELSRDYLRYFLKNKYEVYTAGGVDSFYNIISNIDFNLIIMDVSLRDLKNGIELTEELRSNFKYNKTPIIVLTSFATTKITKAALDAGADVFVTKPILHNQLIDILDEVVAKNSSST